MAIYHYCMKKRECSGKTTMITGVWVLDKPITSMCSYWAFQDEVLRRSYAGERDLWAVESLSRIDRPGDES